jgi:hypothetical protein
MTTLRKWRFPILIGSGLIAAGALIYFSNGHISTEKTQGAIGQREVYRDSQVNSADVAQPGSSPVATQAILESSEFKALAKNASFQELMRDDQFTELYRQGALAKLMGTADFRALAQNAQFAAAFRSAPFQAALRTHSDLFVALKSELKSDSHNAMSKADSHTLDSHTLGLADSNLKMLLKNESFVALANSRLFDHLLSSAAFQANLRDRSFAELANRSDFQAAMMRGSSAELMSHMQRQ